MASSYFDVLTSIINKKNISDGDVLKHFSGFAAIKWLSSHPKALYEANILNSARGVKFIKSLEEYKALKGLVQIPKNTYLKFDKTDKNLKTVLKTIQKHYSVGKTTAQEYYKILPLENITAILEQYSRKNENMMSAKELKTVKDIRDALSNIKKKGK
jgi:hypothetical protein